MSASPARRATPADLPAVRALLAAAQLPHADLDAAALQHFRVVDGADGLSAAVGLEPYGDAALLRSLVVAANARGRGLGAQLVAAIEAEALRAGQRTLYLLTTTAPDFFAALGYRRIDRSAAPAAVRASREFAALCPASAVCMERQLP